MKNIIITISLVILVLLGLAIKDTLFYIDIAPTKNRYLQNEYLSKVHEIKDPNSLYLEVEKQMEFRENERKVQSEKSIKNSKLLGLSMILTILNILLTFIERKKTTT